MLNKKRLVILALTLATLLSIPVATARAEDRAFDAVVKHLKTRYQAKRKRIPFLGLANFAVKIIRPAGVKSIKVAIFDRLVHPAEGERAELQAVLRNAFEQEWQPLVRLFSRKEGNQVFVYARQDKQDIKLMVVNLEQTQAVVVRVKLNPESLAKFMEKPEILGISLASGD